MKIGFLTACFPKKTLEDILPWAAEEKFDMLEVACWPKKNEGEFDSVTIDVDMLDTGKAAQIKASLKKHGVEISSLGYYENMLDPDLAKRAENIEHLKKVISAANMLGCGLVGGFVGRNPQKTLEQNFKEYESVFTDILGFCRKNRVKLMIEPCPMFGWQVEDMPGTISYSPALWKKMFDILPDRNFGLNYDPSHLYWMGIDYVQCVFDFKERIFHVHAKDTEFVKNRVDETGILGHGWWRYRLPGMGEIDWQKFMAALHEIGYDGALSIEHEDPVWSGTDEKIRKGLAAGKKFLAGLV